MTKNNLFIGYYELENFGKIAAGQMVYGALSSASESTKLRGGIEIQSQRVLLQLIESDKNLVHYIYIRTAVSKFANGDPINSKAHDEKVERSLKAWIIIQEYLKLQKIELIDSNISMPKNLLLIQGAWGRLMFNEADGVFQVDKS